jgi:hypothetical protein
MVVALIALLVALSGTANAGPVAQLAKLVSGDKLIKPETLSGNRLRKHTLTGTQINLSKLGTVPKAGYAATAGSAGFATFANLAITATTAQNVAAPEAFHEVGAPGEPGFQNSWQNKGGPNDEPLGFYKDREGVVHLKGGRMVGNPNQVIFQLPPGYRPASGKVLDFPMACECTVSFADPQGGAVTGPSQTGIIGIEGSGIGAASDGAVVILNGTVPLGNAIWLDGITFRAGS